MRERREAQPLKAPPRISVRVADLKEDKDPDEFLKHKGVEAFKKVLLVAKSDLDFRVSVIKQDLDMDNLDDKMEFVNQVVPILSAIENSVYQKEYIKKIAAENQIDEQALMKEIAKKNSRNKRNDGKKQDEIVVVSEPKPKKGKAEMGIRAERRLLRALLEFPEIKSKVKDLIEPDDFEDTLDRQLFQLVMEQDEREESSSLFNKIEEEPLSDFLASLLSRDFTCLDIEKEMHDLLKIMKKEKVKREQNRILEKMKEYQLLGDMDNYKRELLKLESLLKSSP